ncbi:MAG: homogentisate 1,2-dioxygenase domain-containing protein, partial [Janthinobacterium lividum]
ERASTVDLAPHKLTGTMAFMFETRFPQKVTAFAATAPQRQSSYADYGAALVKRFDPTRP